MTQTFKISPKQRPFHVNVSNPGAHPVPPRTNKQTSNNKGKRTIPTTTTKRLLRIIMAGICQIRTHFYSTDCCCEWLGEKWISNKNARLQAARTFLVCKPPTNYASRQWRYWTYRTLFICKSPVEVLDFVKLLCKSPVEVQDFVNLQVASRSTGLR